jgi:cytochrome c peroxidase
MKTLLSLLISLILYIPANAAPPLGLPKLTIPTDNPQSPAKIELGHKLFLDTRFSADGSISCASCHQTDKGFADGQALAIGIYGQIGTRNSPTVINAAYFNQLFLDGRRHSLEQQALDPFTNLIEHGLKSHQPIINTIQQDADYVSRFKQVFNIQAEAITIKHVTKSIASYLRTLISGNSAFDQYLFGRDRSALSASAARGLKVFRRKGNCANCHEISWDHALFTDNLYYNIGIGMQHLEPVLDKLISSSSLSNKIEILELSVQQHSELGRFNITKTNTDIGRFKTPGLRNITLTAPYMHDGSLATLEEVVDYYDQGGVKNPFLDAAIYPLHLSDQEKIDLVSFMKALNGPVLDDTNQ